MGKAHTFVKSFIESFFELIKKPEVAAAYIALFILMTFFSYISGKLLPSFTSSISLTIWTAISFIILLIFVSLVFTFSTSVLDSSAKNTNIKSHFKKVRKKFLGNTLLLVLFVLAFNIVSIGSIYLSLLISRALTLPVMFAQVVFVLIYLIGLLLFTFLTFIAVSYTLNKFSILKAIKDSILVVKGSYFTTIISLIVLAILYYLIDLLTQASAMLSTIILYILFYPFINAVLVRLYNELK